MKDATPPPGAMRDRMLRVFALCVGLAGLLFTAIAHPSVPAHWDLAEPWWNTTAAALLAVPFLALAVGAHTAPTRWLRAAAAIPTAACAPLLLLVPAVYPRDLFRDEYEGVWPMYIVTVVVCAAALHIRSATVVVAVAVATMCAAAVASAWTYADATPGWLAQTTLADLALGLVFAGIILAGLRAAAELDRHTALMKAGAAQRVTVEATLTERGRLDALVHDTVLSALLAGGRGASPHTVRRSAEAALRTLTDLADPATDTGHVPAVELVARLRQVAAHAAEDVVFETSQPRPQQPVAASVARVLQEVVGEALRNSTRHADLPGRTVTRRVTVTLDDTHITATVADDGAGFEPAKVPPQRLGIAMGIRARVAEVTGGTVDIRAAIGHGTVVEVTLPVAATTTRRHPDPPRVEQSGGNDTVPRLLRLHTTPVGVLIATPVLMLAARPWHEGTPGLVGPWYAAALTALLIGLRTVLADSPDPMSRRRALRATAVLALAAALSVSAALGAHTYGAGAMWGWGGATIALGMMSLRGRTPTAWLGLSLVAAVYLAWAALTPGTVDPRLVGVMFVSTVIVLGVCSLFAVLARRYVARLNTVRDRAVALAAHNARTRARLAERDTQLRYLNTSAAPLLHAMRDTGTLREDQQQQALLLEARLRDRIRARGLATPELLDAAETARAAGTHVVLLDDGDLDPADPVLQRVTAIAATELLRTAPGPGDKITIRLLPPGREVLCTIVRSSTDTYDRVEIVAADPPELVGVRQFVG